MPHELKSYIGNSSGSNSEIRSGRLGNWESRRGARWLGDGYAVPAY